MKKSYPLLWFLLYCFAHAYGQSSRPAIRQQLLSIDTIKNDSAAMAMLEQLVKTGDLIPVELLRANARIIRRADALQQFAKSVKLANEGIILARNNGLDSIEGMFTTLAATSNYFMDRKKEALEFFKKPGQYGVKHAVFQA